jgi:NAD+ kinase
VQARTVTVISHARTQQVAPALDALMRAARAEGVTLRFDPDETEKHGLEPGEGIVVDAPVSDDVELCVVFGGDGTILRALRRYAGTSVPVFAVNYGEIGYLATIEPDADGDALLTGMERAVAGDFETLTLPALALETPDGPHAAINDLAIHRRAGTRVARLAYAVAGEEIGSVRCDGLVLATPAGSTGYNLANGGPVMAWGVEGFAVGPQPLAGSGRHLPRRAAGGLDLPGRGDHGELPAGGSGPRAGAGVVVLPAAAREVRAAGDVRSMRRRLVWRS